MTDKPQNGFSDYKQLLLHEIERLNRNLESVELKVENLLIELTALKTKVAIYSSGFGLLAGILSSIIVRLLTK